MRGVNTQTLDVSLKDYYDKTALVKALPRLLYRKFAQVRPLPKNNGEIIRFHRWGILPTAITPLKEGITPTSGSIEKTEITAKVEQYGYWIAVTDKVQMLSPDPILTEIVEELGEQQGDTLDELMRNQLAAGSNVMYAGSVASRASVNTKITASMIDKAIRTLKNANAKMISKMVTPTTGFGTSPIRPAYIAIVHPNTAFDLEDITGFIPVEKYASQTGVMDGEIGAYKNVRFIETTNGLHYDSAGATGGSGVASQDGSHADIYCTMIFAQDAYGEVPLSGASSSIIIKMHGDNDKTDVSDPLNQRGSAGWKTMWTGKILNDNFMIRLEHGVSA